MRYQFISNLVAEAGTGVGPAFESGWRYFAEGGVFMILLGITSVVAMAVIAFKFLTLTRRRIVPSGLVSSIDRICEQTAANDAVGTISVAAREGRSTLARLCAVALGNPALMEELGVVTGSLAENAAAQRREGRTVVFLAVDGAPRALLAVSDPVKESAPEALRDLRDDGLEIVLLTGDHLAAAEAVARTLGITRVEAEVLPDRKAEVVRQLQDEGRVVAMAGDGINDAPALAAARVGIAMGTGTDVAMQSAGVTLVIMA